MAKPHQEKHDTMAVFRRSVLYASVILILPFVVHFLEAYITLFLRFFAPNNESLVHTIPFVQDTIMYGLLTALLFFYLKATFEPMTRYGWTWKRDHLWLAAGIGIVTGVIMYTIDTASGFAFAVAPFSVLAFLGTFIGAALLPAIFEETLFRGVIQGFYQHVTQKKLGPVPLAIIIASTFDVAFHLIFPMYFGGLIVPTLWQLVYVAVFGAIGGYFFYRTGSLVGPITIHLLGNFTEYVLVWLLR